MEDSPEIVLGRRVWYALLRAIDQLIKVLIQSFDICFFSFLSINVHFFFCEDDRGDDSIRSCNFFSLCVQDARIQRREGGKGRYR